MAASCLFLTGNVARIRIEVNVRSIKCKTIVTEMIDRLVVVIELSPQSLSPSLVESGSFG